MSELNQKEYLQKILKEKITDAQLERHSLDIGNLNSSFNGLEKDLRGEMRKNFWDVIIFVALVFLFFIAGVFVENFFFHMNNYKEYISKYEEIKAEFPLLENNVNGLVERVNRIENKIININSIISEQESVEIRLNQLEEEMNNLTSPIK